MTQNMRMNTILWTGVLAPPGAWALQLQTNYALARFLCGNAWLAPAFHVTAIITLLLASSAGAIAYYATRRADVDPAPDAPRQHFMAVISLMMAATFGLLIAAQWSARFFADPCVY